MDAYVQEMQKRLRASKIGYKREFLREIIADVRVFKNKTGGTLKYKIPLPAKNPVIAERSSSLHCQEWWSQ